MELSGAIKKKKKVKKMFHSKKLFKLLKKFQNFFTFQRLIHEINFIVPWSLKNLKKWPNSSVLNNNFSFTQLAFVVVPQNNNSCYIHNDTDGFFLLQ